MPSPAVRRYVDGNWKVIYHYLDQEARYELYDLENDRCESNNLAADDLEQLESMLKAMARELKAKGAQYPQRTTTWPASARPAPSANCNHETTARSRRGRSFRGTPLERLSRIHRFLSDRPDALPAVYPPTSENTRKNEQMK